MAGAQTLGYLHRGQGGRLRRRQGHHLGGAQAQVHLAGGHGRHAGGCQRRNILGLHHRNLGGGEALSNLRPGQGGNLCRAQDHHLRG